MKIEILYIFHKNTINFRAFLPCLRGLPNRCHDYTSLHILLNLCLVLNIVCIINGISEVYQFSQSTVKTFFIHAHYINFRLEFVTGILLEQ